MSKGRRVSATCAIIGPPTRVGKRLLTSAPPQDLQNHRDDEADGDETRGDRDEVPDDAVQGDRQRPQPQHGDADPKAREPGCDEPSLAAGDAPQHAASHEGHDAQPKLQDQSGHEARDTAIGGMRVLSR